MLLIHTACGYKHPSRAESAKGRNPWVHWVGWDQQTLGGADGSGAAKPWLGLM